MNDTQWDRLLNIRTTGRDDTNADPFHHPYEPTPYAVLEKLVQSGYITKKNTVVDYGCGKGRVSFFLHHEIKCRMIGLEYDQRIYEQALRNQTEYSKHNNIMFICEDAVKYKIEDEDCFYFFNPFSVEVLQAVMTQIMSSYYENPRAMKFFFYYPDDAYVAWLMQSDLEFIDEIDCRYLFDGKDHRECILVFGIDVNI